MRRLTPLLLLSLAACPDLSSLFEAAPPAPSADAKEAAPTKVDASAEAGNDDEPDGDTGDDEVHPVDRGPGSDVSPEKVARAKLLWDTHCSRCHGRAAAGTDKAPALGGADWDAATTDEHIKKIVVEGGAAAGKSAKMPAHPNLGEDPELLGELVTIIRNTPDWYGQ